MELAARKRRWSECSTAGSWRWLRATRSSAPERQSGLQRGGSWSSMGWASACSDGSGAEGGLHRDRWPHKSRMGCGSSTAGRLLSAGHTWAGGHQESLPSQPQLSWRRFGKPGRSRSEEQLPRRAGDTGHPEPHTLQALDTCSGTGWAMSSQCVSPPGLLRSPGYFGVQSEPSLTPGDS